jgi:hypothetical protein
VQFVKSFFDAGKPVAAICHGPWTVIEAGAARGRKITSWLSLNTDLRNAGAEWLDQEVVADGNLVSSRSPDDIPHSILELSNYSATPSERLLQRRNTRLVRNCRGRAIRVPEALVLFRGSRTFWARGYILVPQACSR